MPIAGLPTAGVRRNFLILLRSGAATISFVLCVAAISLWVRSYLVQDTVYLHRSRAVGGRFLSADHRFFAVRGQVIWKASTYDQPENFARGHDAARARSGLRDFVYSAARTDRFHFNPAASSDPWWVRAGFRYDHSSPPPRRPGDPMASTQAFYEAGLPHWLAVALTLPLPAAFVATRLRRRRRRDPTLCPTCGYDCRGPADGTLLARCPECGTDLPSPRGTSPMSR